LLSVGFKITVVTGMEHSRDEEVYTYRCKFNFALPQTSNIMVPALLDPAYKKPP
jgi:hypothetical protein